MIQFIFVRPGRCLIYEWFWGEVYMVPFVYFSVMFKYLNHFSIYKLNIGFTCDRCRRSCAAATPAKYAVDSKILMYDYNTADSTLTDKLTLNVRGPS